MTPRRINPARGMTILTKAETMPGRVVMLSLSLAAVLTALRLIGEAFGIGEVIVIVLS